MAHSEHKNVFNQNDELKHSVNTIPYAPAQLELSDIHPNGKLLTDSEIVRIKNQLKDAKDDRYKKTELKSAYSIIKANDRYFAIYKGAKHNKLVGDPGSFGSVKLAQDLTTGVWYALKVQSLTQENKNELDEEKRKESETEHKNLAQTGVDKSIIHIVRQSPSKGWQSNILMQLAPGIDLKKWINKSADEAKIIPRPNALFITDFTKRMLMAIHVLQAIKQVHKSGVIHCDIKLENIVFDVASKLMTVVDFGLSLKVAEGGAFLVTSNKLSGTESYLAPEMRKKGKNQPVTYDEKTEVYALGKLIASLLELTYGERRELLSSVEDMRNEILQFLNKMVNEKANRRPTLDEAIAEFQRFYQEILLPLATRSVGVLDLEEFITSDQAHKQALMDALKLVDEVYLVDASGKYNQLDLINVRKLLEANSVCLSDKIFHAPGVLVNKLVEQVPLHMMKHEPSIISSFFYVTGKNNLPHYLQNKTVAVIQAQPNMKIENYYEALTTASHQYISNNQRQYMADVVQDELKKMLVALGKTKSDFKKARLATRRDVFQKVLAELSKKSVKHLTYERVFGLIDDLQKSMLTTSKSAAFMAKKFAFYKPKVKGKDAIDEMKKEMQSRFLASRKYTK